MFVFAEQTQVQPRDLTGWSAQQRKMFKTVAGRYQQETAAFYSLLALGVVGAVKLAQFKATLPADEPAGSGIVL